MATLQGTHLLTRLYAYSSFQAIIANICSRCHGKQSPLLFQALAATGLAGSSLSVPLQFPLSFQLARAPTLLTLLLAACTASQPFWSPLRGPWSHSLTHPPHLSPAAPAHQETSSLLLAMEIRRGPSLHHLATSAGASLSGQEVVRATVTWRRTYLRLAAFFGEEM